MDNGISLITSGFQLVDSKWGGIYRGGSYIIVGPRKSGRTLLGLQFAIESAKSSEVCLYFTNMRPKDLMIQATSLNFDIQSYMNKNLLIVVRVAPPNDIYDMYNPDDYLIEYINDIITVVNQYNPNRIIFDELTPYIGFRSLDLLRDVFLHTLETIEERNITSFFVLGEPATQKAQEIVSLLTDNVTGTIFLKKHDEKISGKYYGGTAIITPNVGHNEGQFSAEYRIEPYYGITVDVPGDEKKIEKFTKEIKEQPPIDIIDKPLQMDYDFKKTSDNIVFSNVYNQSDFRLIVNNQIALFQSTGQTFNLISFKLDPAVQVKGLLSVNQLQNSINLSISKRDKLSVIDNKVVVILIRSTQKSVPELMEKLKQNMPSYDESYLNAIIDYISIINIEIDSSYKNANELIDPIVADDAKNEYISLSNYDW